MKPIVNVMIKLQALQVPPWKTTVWIPRVLDVLLSIEHTISALREAHSAGLENVFQEGETSRPDKILTPLLYQHWDTLSHTDAQQCTFQGVPLLEGWIIVGEVNGDTEDDKTKIYASLCVNLSRVS